MAGVDHSTVEEVVGILAGHEVTQHAVLAGLDSCTQEAAQHTSPDARHVDQRQVVVHWVYVAPHDVDDLHPEVVEGSREVAAGMGNAGLEEVAGMGLLGWVGCNQAAHEVAGVRTGHAVAAAGSRMARTVVVVPLVVGQLLLFCTRPVLERRLGSGRTRV